MKKKNFLIGLIFFTLSSVFAELSPEVDTLVYKFPAFVKENQLVNIFNVACEEKEKTCVIYYNPQDYRSSSDSPVWLEYQHYFFYDGERNIGPFSKPSLIFSPDKSKFCLTFSQASYHVESRSTVQDYYVLTESSIYGPFNKITGCCYSSDNVLTFSYQLDDWYYINTDEKDEGPYRDNMQALFYDGNDLAVLNDNGRENFIKYKDYEIPVLMGYFYGTDPENPYLLVESFAEDFDGLLLDAYFKGERLEPIYALDFPQIKNVGKDMYFSSGNKIYKNCQEFVTLENPVMDFVISDDGTSLGYKTIIQTEDDEKTACFINGNLVLSGDLDYYNLDFYPDKNNLAGVLTRNVKRQNKCYFFNVAGKIGAFDAFEFVTSKNKKNAAAAFKTGNTYSILAGGKIIEIGHSEVKVNKVLDDGSYVELCEILKPLVNDPWYAVDLCKIYSIDEKKFYVGCINDNSIFYAKEKSLFRKNLVKEVEDSEPIAEETENTELNESESAE